MNRSVLIADGQRARAERIAEACAARGFVTRRVAHGAAALEAALAEVPQVLIATVELQLIDGAQLARILRANPRTQDVRFLFLGRDAGEMGFLDELLPPSVDAEEAAGRVEAMLAQRERMEAVKRDADAAHEVQGRLSQMPLSDLLQLFHMNGRTGTLALRREGAEGREERGEIAIRDGNLVQASVGQVEGEKAFFRLLAWRDGSFAFAPVRVGGAPRILTPTRALLIEGMRQLDEWARLRESLPSRDAQIILDTSRRELPGSVHALSQEVLMLLELYDRVGEVVDHCSHPDYQVLRTLQALAEKGLIRLRREPGALRRPAGESLFEAVQLRRLREWLGSEGRDGRRAAKLLVVSPDAEVTRDLVRLLAGLPGMQLAEPFQRGSFSAEDLVPLGRLALEEGLALQLIHVPAAPRDAPIWPLAARDALGTLLVLADAKGEAAFEPIRSLLRRTPRARIFHLLLLRKGERLGPEKLQGKLGLLDDASLFLVPLESGKDPVALLRTMLARVLP